MKVKIFSNKDPHELTNLVNQWLSENTNIIILDKQCCGTGNGTGMGTITQGSCFIIIWYKTVS